MASPDLVLLDFELPEIDGYKLACLLRENGLASTPIIALSCHDDDPVRRCAAIITAHYVKPIGKEELEAILAQVSMGVFCSTKNDRSVLVPSRTGCTTAPLCEMLAMSVCYAQFCSFGWPTDCTGEPNRFVLPLDAGLWFS